MLLWTGCRSARVVASGSSGIVGCSFLIELEALDGRARLKPHPVTSLIRFSE